MVKVDRAKVIRQDISDYNALAEKAKKRKELANLIELKAQSQSPEGQAFIKGVLEQPQTYIKYETLAN